MAEPTLEPIASSEPALFAALSALLLAPLWSATLPPMVDLPQHAAQLAMAERYLSGDPQLVAEHVLNWFTPNLACYAPAWALAQVFGVVVALKLVLSLALLGVPLATRALVVRSGGDPRWALLAFPTAYGYAFNWGFMNFVVAAPFGIAALLVAAGHAREPRVRSAVALFACLVGVFFAHALVFVLLALCGAALVLARAPRPREAALGLAPLAAAAPIALGWTWLTAPVVGNSGFVFWALDATRPIRVFSGVVGGEPDFASFAAGALLLGLPLLLGARVRREPPRLAPLAVVVLLCLALPRTLFGTAFLFERFSLFVLPFWLFALERGEPTPALARLRRVGEWSCAAAPALLLAVTLARFVAFDQESRAARELIASLPEGARVLALVPERDSAYAPAPVYLHFPSWYAVQHRGTVDFSFAAFFPNLLRYRDGASPALPEKFEWAPRLEWVARSGQRFDMLIVRASEEPPAALLLGAAEPPFERIAHVENWFVYARPRSAARAVSAESD